MAISTNVNVLWFIVEESENVQFDGLGEEKPETAPRSCTGEQRMQGAQLVGRRAQ
jgi:hypothetical protein